MSAAEMVTGLWPVAVAFLGTAGAILVAGRLDFASLR